MHLGKYMSTLDGGCDPGGVQPWYASVQARARNPANWCAGGAEQALSDKAVAGCIGQEYLVQCDNGPGVLRPGPGRGPDGRRNVPLPSRFAGDSPDERPRPDSASDWHAEPAITRSASVVTTALVIPINCAEYSAERLIQYHRFCANKVCDVFCETSRSGSSQTAFDIYFAESAR